MINMDETGISYSSGKITNLRNLSHSSIKTFNQCARKFLLKNQLPRQPTSPAFLIGRAFHKTIETMIRNKEDVGLEESKRNLNQYWETSWESSLGEAEQKEGIDWECTSPEQNKGVGTLMLMVPEIIEALCKLRPQTDEAGIYLERRVELRVPGVPIPVIGYIDMKDDMGTLVEFKTAGRAWSDNQATREVQPLFYLAAVQQQEGGTNLEFIHYVFTKTKNPKVQVFRTTRTQGEIMWLMETIREIWEQIEAGIFPRNPEGCFAYHKPCPYLNICWGK